MRKCHCNKVRKGKTDLCSAFCVKVRKSADTHLSVLTNPNRNPTLIYARNQHTVHKYSTPRVRKVRRYWRKQGEVTPSKGLERWQHTTYHWYNCGHEIALHDSECRVDLLCYSVP